MAERNLQPREELFVGRTEPRAHRLQRRDHTHLPEQRSEQKIVEEKADGVREKQDHDHRAVFVRFARRARERPGTELHHKRRTARHPPQHLAAAAKIIARVPDKLAANPPDHRHVRKIKPDDQIIVFGQHEFQGRREDDRTTGNLARRISQSPAGSVQFHDGAAPGSSNVWPARTGCRCPLHCSFASPLTTMSSINSPPGQRASPWPRSRSKRKYLWYAGMINFSSQ